MAKREVDIKVKYIPDTSALKSALSGAQKIDFKIGGSGLKKELLTPVQNAMREVNKAIASGADNKTLLKLFQDVGKAADLAKNKAQGMLNELNTVFSSSGNQKLLDDLKTYEKELEKSQKKLAAWDKKYSTKTGVESDYSKLRDTVIKESNGNIKTLTEARAEIKKLTEDTKELSQVELERLNNLKQFAELGTERQNNPRKALELDVNKYQGLVNDTKVQVQTPNVNIEGTKTYTAIIRTLGEAAGLSAQEINRLTTAIGREDKAAEKAAESTKKELVKVGDLISATFLGTSLNTIFQTAISNGIQFFKEYDEVLTRTMMVTGMSREEVNNLTASYNRLATQLSSTTKDVAAAQLVFYQQGLNTREAMQMTEASIAISKTGGIEAGEAANRLTAAIRGYKLAANDAMDIADKMSALDAAAASSVDELTVAMQKSASQARMAGLDLDYYMAYLSTMQEVTREAPENIGTAMKSITSRIQEITDIGKVEEDGTTFSNVAKALNSIGIAAVDSSGQLRSLQDIMNDLGPMWATLDKNHKAYIATVLAGNRQQSRFIALMDNYDRAMELVNVSQNANGESAKQLRAYNQGLEASFTRLSNAWQKFATQLIESSSISKIVQQIAKLIELVNKFPAFVKGAVGLYALNKSIDTLHKLVNSNLGSQLRKLIDVKPDADGLRWYDSAIDKIKKWINIQKESSKIAEDSVGAINRHSAALTDDSVSIEKNTNSQITNNSVNTEEISEQEAVTGAVQAKADTYKRSTKNIIQEQNATQDNGKTYLQEIDENIAIAESNIQKYEGMVKESEKQVKPFLDKIKKAEAESKKAYKEAVTDENLTRVAKEVLDKKGIKAPIGQLSLDLDNKGNGLTIASEEMKQYEKALESEKKWQKTFFGIQRNNESKKYKADLALLRQKPEDLELQKWKKKVKEEQKKRDQLKKDYDEALKRRKAEQEEDKSLGDSSTKKEKSLLSSITTPFMIKSLTQMGVSILGINSNVSELIGNFASLGYVGVNAFKDINKAAKSGASSGRIVAMSISAAAVSIIGIIGAISKMMNGLEANQDKLDKVLEKSSSIGDKITNGQKALDTYNKLSNKILKTEEEQQELNAAANELGDILPDIVSGYDAVGNSIISASTAQLELNKLAQEKRDLDNESLDLYAKTTKAKGKADPFSNMMSVGGTALSVATGVSVASGGSLAIPAYVIAGIATLATGAGTALYNFVTEADRTTEALIEDRDEIIGALKSITQVLPEYEGLKNNLVEQIYNQGIEEGFGIEEMRDKLSDMTKQLNSKGISNLISKMKIKITDPNLVYDDFKKQVIDGLKRLGFSDEQIDLTFDGIINLIFDGKFNYGAVMESLKEKLNDKTISKELKNGLEQVLRLDQRLVEELYSSGMLDTSFIEHVFGTMTAEQINDNFYVNDRYDPYAGIGVLIENSYTSLEEKEKQLIELEKKNEELALYNQQVQDDIERNWALAPGAHWGAAMADPRYENGTYASDYDGGEPAEPEVKHKEFMSGELSAEEYTKYVEDRIKALENLSDEEKENAIIAARLSIKTQDNNNQMKRNKEIIDELTPEIENLSGVQEELISKYRELNQMPTFQEMADTINKAISPMKNLNSVLSDIYDQNGKVTFDNLISLLETLQQIQDASLEAGISTTYFNQACHALAEGISLENGMITMNISATEMMQNVAAAAYRAQMQQMADKIEANIEEMKMQKDMIDQEILFLQEKLLTAEDGASAEKMIETDLKNYLDSVHVAAVKATSQKYKDELIAAEAYYSQLTAMQLKAARGEEITAGEFTGIFDNLVRGVGSSIKKEIDFTDDDPNSGWRQQVQDRIYRLQEQSRLLGDAINGQGELKRKLMQFATDPNLDLGKTLGNGLEKAGDELDKYIGKLERTFNLIQKIDRLSHQISDNSNLKDLYKNYDGTKYADSLLTELGLMKERYEYQKQLFKMQQEEVGKQRGKIEDSPYASLFSFDKNDLIQIDWDRYNKLGSRDKEEIDTLVERYEELQDAVESTEIEMAEFAKATQEAWLEIENTIIEAENTIVDALKNREKILHDTRVKALDDEIDMIEKAVEARQRARESENDNKELYQAQEALRRATLDSSGKNNASLLQLQQDLEDKQLEISEKRFEQDMEDRKNWLQDTKDAETETYEYRLETMTWYWEEAQVIMESGTENIMNFLMQWDEQYRISSETQQQQILRGWTTMYEEIQRLYDKGFDLTTFHNQMQDVVNDLSLQEINIYSIETAWTAATNAVNEYKAAFNGIKAGTMLGTGYTGTNGDSEKGGVGPIPDTSDSSYRQYINKEVEIKGTGTYKGYDINGKEKTYKKEFGVNENLIINDIMKKDDVYYALGTPMSGPNQGVEHWIPVDELQTLDFWGGKKLKKNANGGIVDYTGPTWVDGSKTHPEAFLSAYQTEQIGALAGALDSNTVNNVSGDSNVTFGSINFNVASMSSAADGRKALDIFVQGANDLMAKKGVNTKINLNIK